MYARLVKFTLGQGMRPAAEQLADQFAAAHLGMQGFKDHTFLADD